VTCNSGLRMMVLVVVAAGIAAPGEARAVPPRRLARRGVIVVPAPGTGAVVTPAPSSAAVVVGPALRPRRRMVVVPGPVAVPGASRMAAAPSVAGRPPAVAPPAAPPRMPTPAPSAPATAAASAKSEATAAVIAKPTTTAPEQIPTPRPTPAQSSAGQPTVAAATPAAAESVAFTAEWYAKHPQAWRPAKAQADWWKNADVATITAWLGQPVTAAGTAADSGNAVATAGGADAGADGLQSVLVLPAGHQNAVGPADSDWLPLGVFAVLPPGTQDTDQAHNYQQLAVDRQGTIKGNFYDTLSGTVQPITGTVDRNALAASWTVGANGSRFTAPMRAFAGQPRTVSMSSGGQPRDLQLMPVQRPY
jgi:hypothetical protein